MSNETIFREVDEELRSDRMRTFWKRFGPYVIGGAVAVVLIVAANEGWSWWQNSQAAQASDKFYAALEIADGTDAAAAEQAFFDVETTSPAGYATLARFRQAGLLAKEGKADESAAAYDALATSESNQHLKSLALVFAANLFIDRGDVAAVEQRVQGLITPDNPMRNAAREALGLAQYKAGDIDAARATLEQILGDPMTSQEMGSRIQVYVAQLTAQGAANPAGEPVEAAAPAADPATPPEAMVAPATEPAAPAAETSVGTEPVIDVTEPAPAPEAAAPAADAAAPAADAAAPATTTEGSAAGN